MAGQQPNVWSNRPRNPPSAPRTPQSRSGTGSPSQSGNVNQLPQQEGGRQQGASSVWSQRNSRSGDRQSTTSNGSPARSSVPAQTEEHYSAANGFNTSAVKAFLCRNQLNAPPTYKSNDGSAASRATGAAWGSKANCMANNQTFLSILGKQVAALESGE